MVSIPSRTPTSGGGRSGSVSDYHDLGRQRRDIYRYFSFAEAVQARGSWRLTLVLGATILLIGELIRYAPFLVARLASLVWSTAFAATAGHNPAGLPEGVFTFLVVVFVFL